MSAIPNNPTANATIVIILVFTFIVPSPCFWLMPFRFDNSTMTPVHDSADLPWIRDRVSANSKDGTVFAKMRGGSRQPNLLNFQKSLHKNFQM
jgi:hypothetical protein